MNYYIVTTASEIATATRLHQVIITSGTLTLAKGTVTVAEFTSGTWADVAGYPLTGLTITGSSDLAISAMVS